MDITTCDIEEPQRKYRLGSVSNRILLDLIKLVLLDPNLRSSLLQWFETFGPHEDSLTQQ